MRLLLVLVSRSGQIVSKQEIFARVWDTTTTDNSLSASVYQLRKALGDVSGRPRYIETIPKRGYRLLVDAQFQAAAPSVPTTSRTESPEQTSGFAADAIEAFAKGQALLASHRSTNLLQAKLYFEHALALEARFAAAHASLASAHVALLYNGQADASSAQQARWNARAAVDLDPLLGWAHAAQALVHGFIDSNFSAADVEYKIALELRPDLVVSRRRYALLLAVLQRPEEALHQLAEAKRYDPVNISSQHEVAHIFFMLRRFDRSAEELLKVLAREPRSWTAYAQLAFIYWIRGDAAQVVATYRSAARACDTTALLTRIDQGFAAGGVAGLYSAVASHLEGRDPKRRYHLQELVATHIAAGDHARALQLLEAGREQGDPNAFWLVRSPFVDPLRTERAFQLLEERYATPVPQNGAPSVHATRVEA